MKTFLLVAAERRELEGFLRKIGKSSPLKWPGARFAREAEWQGDHWFMIANGPGPRNIDHALSNPKRSPVQKPTAMISTGFCGALHPELKHGDIVVASEAPETTRPYVHGRIVSQDRVAVTPREKELLFEQTSGALAVEMEAVTVRDHAEHWNVPFRCVRVVSDTADETLPMDFNRYRTPLGDFSRSKIAMAALASPFTLLPKLMEFDRRCRLASEVLGDFLADCRF